MTPPEVENLEQTRIVAEKAIEIVQDCRKALGLQKGESLTEAVTRLADDRERLQAALTAAEREIAGLRYSRETMGNALAADIESLRSRLEIAEQEREQARDAIFDDKRAEAILRDMLATQLAKVSEGSRAKFARIYPAGIVPAKDLKDAIRLVNRTITAQSTPATASRPAPTSTDREVGA